MAKNFCGGKTCFGTACNCDPGESCVDTASKAAPVMGKTCGILSGGTCVSNAVGEAVYGLSPSDLLPCCGKGCFPGQKCEVGWRSDGEYAYARVVGVCGGSCGNGTCDPGETAACPDCGTTCGDDKCFPEEMAGGKTPCTADCADVPKCGTPGESNATWSNLTICGDGVCDKGKTDCDWSMAESCRTCPQDCGVCDWELAAGRSGIVEPLFGLWGSSGSDVFAVGSAGTILHYDGKSWKPMKSGSSTGLRGLWGGSGTDVFAVSPSAEQGPSFTTMAEV